MLDRRPYLIELLTPRQADEDFETRLQVFGERYRRILDHGAVVSIPDNPLGTLHFTAMETVEFLGLPAPPRENAAPREHLPPKPDLDTFLDAARNAGLKHLLVVSGDGGPRLPKLEPSDIGSSAKTVTSVELLEYIERRYPGEFRCGVAFNHYEPEEHEMAKLRRKVEAGAGFVITQPVIDADATVASLGGFKLPVWVGAWMSKRVELLRGMRRQGTHGERRTLRSRGQPGAPARPLPRFRAVPRAAFLQERLVSAADADPLR